MSELILVGRSSSHFTRTVRIFAHELGIAYAFRPVLDLMALDSAVFGGNPALRIPVLVDDAGFLSGTENICREIVRRSGAGRSVVLPGDVPVRVVANAEELTLHVMSTEVSILTAKMSGASGGGSPKAMKSLEDSLGYLDDHVEEVLAALPADRLLSFVEVALFSAMTHLPFREVLDVTRWSHLGAFTKRFAKRASAVATEYRFDAA